VGLKEGAEESCKFPTKEIIDAQNSDFVPKFLKMGFTVQKFAFL